MDDLGCPDPEETEYFFPMVPLSFFQVTGILNMQDPPVGIKDDEDGKTKAPAMVQALHQCCSLLRLLRACGLAGIVVHMDVLEILFDDSADCRVAGYEVGKPQAPGAPVPAHLTDDELALRPGSDKGMVYLYDRVYRLIVDSLQATLGTCRPHEENGKQREYRPNPVHVALHYGSIFVLVEEEVFLGGVVGPDVFDVLVDVTFVLYLLEVLDDLEGSAAADGIIDEFLLGGGPGSVFEFGCKF